MDIGVIENVIVPAGSPVDVPDSTTGFTSIDAALRGDAASCLDATAVEVAGVAGAAVADGAPVPDAGSVFAAGDEAASDAGLSTCQPSPAGACTFDWSGSTAAAAVAQYRASRDDARMEIFLIA
ncbi:hypothetical protein [Paraburkholderia tropica]|uniref:hypothetical protein n=1 Tax=Paraburkholderia tropica TaxID=92647 RepID=UPI0021AC4270|nr:hypothetical protein [Paraburkholderia tropica]